MAEFNSPQEFREVMDRTFALMRDDDDMGPKLRDADTPQPWVNVIANERFGTVVGATGAAWTWSQNSRENRLTPFGNDVVSEFSGEAVYLRDEDRAEFWGATPGPLPRSPEGGRF